jgi:hypothetical protein
MGTSHPGPAAGAPGGLVRPVATAAFTMADSPDGRYSPLKAR